MLVLIVSTLVIMMVFRRDAAKLHDLTNETGRSTIHYTLSMKFQLAENVRVTKWVTYASVGLSLWGTAGCCMFCVSFVIFGEQNPISQLVYAVFNFYLALRKRDDNQRGVAITGHLFHFRYHPHRQFILGTSSSVRAMSSFGSDPRRCNVAIDTYHFHGPYLLYRLFVSFHFELAKSGDTLRDMACFTATLSLRPFTTKMMITKCYMFSCLITLVALDSMLV
ncbi:hypothetical protein Y032_0323g2510 [Ancylostoma ceylanicum]|nr:hypothetical protein Y032_0323g2510 [Ancylostoma ceylanicum]